MTDYVFDSEELMDRIAHQAKQFSQQFNIKEHFISFMIDKYQLSFDQLVLCEKRCDDGKMEYWLDFKARYPHPRKINSIKRIFKKFLLRYKQ